MCVHSMLTRTFKNVLTNSVWAFLVPLGLGGEGGGVQSGRADFNFLELRDI